MLEASREHTSRIVSWFHGSIIQEVKEGVGANSNYAKTNKQNNNAGNILEELTQLEKLTSLEMPLALTQTTKP